MLPAIQIMPSILAADFGDLRAECHRLVEAGADQLHIDVMDGVFVPNLSFGAQAVKVAVGAIPLNVHLMMINPGPYLDDFAKAGADTISIHVESNCDAVEALRNIRALGARAGITLNPKTPVEQVFDIVEAGLADEVLVMSVEPGFGGQAYMAEVEEKLLVLRRRWPDLDLAIDGGIDDRSVQGASAHGANLIVSGSHLFKQPALDEAISILRSEAEEHQFDLVE
ncbi:MAG: ribulose-phosphate 3-epimerase [Kiritimatiellaceae bacterium]|jgi:ribulose-phosphate 3-epimerase|nr:ribulose-phosphate 3-epimerase [Kiritimatiellaceae bacterium]|tara:strand:- start:1298 stop:1972 length:675 start_codon:yes stop_codon:yes gene_type:complete